VDDLNIKNESVPKDTSIRNGVNDVNKKNLIKPMDIGNSNNHEDVINKE